ncbi:GUN4 domain-containing protein [Cyanobacteria bacterium FACHB-63]|nr:GUN4 domain-containing protein [Cyanobacteria bacterium FACHB-63]
MSWLHKEDFIPSKKSDLPSTENYEIQTVVFIKDVRPVNEMLNPKWLSRNLMVTEIGAIGLSSLLAPYLLASPTSTLSPTLSQQSSPVSNSLKSQQGIDYAPLQQLLQTGKWQAANQLTSVLVLRAARQEQQGYLRAVDIRNLPCSDLQIVDRLWKNASNGRFSFSAQAIIWRNLKGSSYEDSLRFEQKVGWNTVGAQPVLDSRRAPTGYLPFRPAGKTGIMNAFGGWWIREMPIKLEQCGIK